MRCLETVTDTVDWYKIYKHKIFLWNSIIDSDRSRDPNKARKKWSVYVFIKSWSLSSHSNGTRHDPEPDWRRRRRNIRRISVTLTLTQTCAESIRHLWSLKVTSFRIIWHWSLFFTCGCDKSDKYCLLKWHGFWRAPRTCWRLTSTDSPGVSAATHPENCQPPVKTVASSDAYFVPFLTP